MNTVNKIDKLGFNKKYKMSKEDGENIANYIENKKRISRELKIFPYKCWFNAGENRAGTVY